MLVTPSKNGSNIAKINTMTTSSFIQLFIFLVFLLVLVSSHWIDSLLEDDLEPKMKMKDFEKCFNSDGEIYSPCRAKLSQLRPTQVAVGRVSATCKHDRYVQKEEEGSLKKFLTKEKRWIPAILGWNEKLYIIDHHHQCFGLSMMGYDSWVIVKIVEDVSDQFETESAFWDYMRSKKWMYPHDERGQPLQSYSNIPKKITELKNDPYRTLASLMIYYGGIGKVQSEFSEFVWANYIRSQNLSLPYTASVEVEVKYLRAKFPEAMKIVKDERASDIPGYGQGNVDIPDCELLKNFSE